MGKYVEDIIISFYKKYIEWILRNEIKSRLTSLDERISVFQNFDLDIRILVKSMVVQSLLITRLIFKQKS